MGSLAPSHCGTARRDPMSRAAPKKCVLMHKINKDKDKDKDKKPSGNATAREIMPKSRQEPIIPSLAIEDILRSQELIAKMSGKPFTVGEKSNRKGKTMHKKVIAEEKVERLNRHLPLELDNEDENSVEAQIKKMQLIDDNNTNEGAFVYLKQKEEGDPYSLIYCKYQEVEITGGRFYTLSKKGFTSYFQNEPTEFVTVIEWIMEREMYEHIKSFTFFKLFRLWKAIKYWRHNVIYNKRKGVKESLEKKLMFTKRGFGQLLIMHRANCRELESQQMFNTIEPDEAYSINKFEAMQEAHIKKISAKVLEVSNKTKQRFLEEITKTLDDLKLKIRENIQLAEKERNSSQQQTIRGTGQLAVLIAQSTREQEAGRLMEIDAVYEHLGFSSNLSFAHRAEVRKECKKFIRFSYLLDFIAKTSLKAMYLNSIQLLDSYLKSRNDIGIPKELPQLRNTFEFLAEKSGKPVILIQANLKETAIPNDLIKYETIDQYEKPPCGKIDEKNFDPTCHLQSTEEIADPNMPLNYRAEFSAKIKRAYVENIGEEWIKLSPEISEIKAAILTCVSKMLETISKYERHSKSDYLQPYASVLEEWDDKVADKWEVVEDNKLPCQDVLEEEPEYMRREKIVEEHIKKMEQNIKNYLVLFDSFLLNYWRYSRIPWELVGSDKLREPVDVITLFVKQMRKHKEEFSGRIPNKADLGYCRINMLNMRQRITKAPDQAHKNMDAIMPKYLTSEGQKVKEWLEKWKEEVQCDVQNAMKYVAQVNAMKYVESHLEEYAERRERIKEFLTVCKNYEIRSPKDELYVELMQLSTELARVMCEEKDKGDRRKEEFKIELRKMIESVRQGTELLGKDTNDPSLIDVRSNTDITLDKIESLKERCKILLVSADQCVQIQESLEIPVTSFEFVEDVKSEINIRGELWQSLRDFRDLVNKWKLEKFSEINTTLLSENAERHAKIALRCENRGLKDSTAVQTLKREVMQFKETMPVVEALGNRKLKAVHWEEIKQIINTDIKLEDREFTLENLLSLDTAKHKEEIHNISVTASQEDNLTRQIEEKKRLWEKRGFSITTLFKEQQRDQITMISESEQLFMDLDDTLSTLNNIIGSRYVRRLLENAIAVKQEFDMLWQVADEWVHCQRNWRYLDSIFSSADIRLHLKKETSDFETVDKAWRPLMRQINIPSKNVLLHYSNQEHLKKLMKLNKQMDKIKKELQNYLETKRKEFPRFYFLSDGELLPIMSRATEILACEPILPKCFDGIVRLNCGQVIPPFEIIGMYSAEGEHVTFKSIRLKPEENVVNWLKTVETTMVEHLKRYIKTGYNDYYLPDFDRPVWVLKHYAQVVSCVSQLMWTEMCEYSIKEMNEDDSALIELANQNVGHIKQLIELIRGNLTPLQREIVIALITTDVHWRSIIEKLATESVSNVQDFIWQAQLRYYFVEDPECDFVIVKQVNAQTSYGYEYIGAASRLVVTPLTERCYLTITSALRIQLGAAPAGPAGTGKTETVKDLAKALAIQCVVFNCSEQIEIKIMGRLFAGLVQQGAWACLDEFNRIDIEVLSVIAQQILQIRDALRSEKHNLVLNEIDMQAKGTLGIFITMNPNYAGRTELPDNLKILFRPIAMMIPDYSLIAEILLFAQGFQNAKNLALKMTQLYKLASEQLSQQDHYDFGMRAIKSVLVIAGSLKKREPGLSEDVLLIRAMRDANIPKFLADDLQLFLQLIHDLFPSLDIPETNYGPLGEELLKSLEKNFLSPGQVFVTKMLQLFECFNVRFGVMIIGLPGVGKTTCYQVLKEAMTSLRLKSESNQNLPKDPRYQRVEVSVICPKAISLGELYGEESKDTKEWKYGIASKLMKKSVAQIQKKQSEHQANAEIDNSEDKHWIVFDGPVDSKWIENMNSVLDDSRMLCLANAERIKLPNQIRVLFEVQDLACASLATVSRCGMVYISPTDLGWRAFIDSWWKRIEKSDEYFGGSEELKPVIVSLMEDSIEKAVVLMDKFKSNLPFPVTIIQLLTTFTLSLQYWMSKLKKEETFELKKKKITAYFAFSLLWSFGGPLTEKSHPIFDEMVRAMFPKLQIPLAGTMFDFKIEVTENGSVVWKHWKEYVPHFKFSSSNTFFSLFVPTVDTEKYSYIMELAVNMQRPSFFTGETGVGKTLIIRNLLSRKQGSGEVNAIFMVFSANTSSSETQLGLESKLEPKKFRKVLGPPGQTIGTIFVDDVNMPIREVSGAQPPIELLRQLLTYGGFYSRTKQRWTQIVNCTLFCAAGPPGGGRNVLSQRFTQKFGLYCIPEPKEENMQYIFDNILGGFLKEASFIDSIRKLGTIAVSATIELYANISKSLKPTPSKFHYIYNLRDLSKVFQCMLMTKHKSVNSNEVFTRLWIHECMRIFGDRLVTKEDRDWLQKYIINLLDSKFHFEWTVEDVFAKRTIIFTDLCRIDNEVEDRPYEEILDIKKLVRVMDDVLINYNQKNVTNKMGLVFFTDAVCYIAKIERTLRQKRGSCLLIGVSGCGKESYSNLAAFALDSRFFKIRSSRNFRRDTFKEEMKALMKETGMDGKSVTFMLNDNQLTNGLFLEDINSILNTGEINNLYKTEEMDAIIRDMGPIMVKLKRPESKEGKYSTFLERIRDNLHIILSMSPVGESFRSRCRKYPSLINCCTLIYFDKWPSTALESVCSKFLEELGYMDKNLQHSLTYIFPMIHLSVEEMTVTFFEELRRKFYVTPKSYIDAIKFFISSLEETREKYSNNIERLSKGLKNFHATAKLVVQLQETLTKLQPIIEENTIKANKSLKLKEVEAKKVADEDAKIEYEKNILYQQKAIIEVSRAEAKKELDTVQPLLDDAQAGLSSLNPKDIGNIKSYNNPPKMVVSVMQAVLILLENNNKVKHDWAAAKAVLIQGEAFIKRLKDLDFRKLSENTIKLLKGVTTFFDLGEIANSDKACVSLASWCLAMQKCYESYQKVAPLEEKLKKVELEYKTKMEEVKIMEDALEVVKQQLKQLEAEYRKLSEEAKELNDKKEKSVYQLANAEKLISLLGEEGERWTVSVAKLKEEEKEVLGNIFLSAASISYIGPLTTKYRKLLLEGWQELCKVNKLVFSPDFSIINTLGNPMEIKRWNIHGLPADHISMENGILATKTRRWPLMIDPEGQANKWIRNMEKSNDLSIVKMESESIEYIKAIDKAIQGGKALLLDDVQQEFDSCLYTVLGRKTFKSDVGERISFGDKDIPYDPHFRLYLTCKQANPHFLPEICIMLSVINFAVTFDALEEQLLVEVVMKEKPDVEQERTQRITEIAAYQNQLRIIESDILEKLTNSNEDTILNNVDLIKSLERSKISSGEIESNIKEAMKTEQEVTKAREEYRNVATRGAILYFVLVDIAKIDPMYQYSFVFLKKLFNDALDIKIEADNIKEKKEQMISNVTKVIYRNVCRGLFEVHKLVFSFLVASQINLRETKIKIEDWDLLIRGAGVVTGKEIKVNPLPHIITDSSWNLAYAVEEKIYGFIGLRDSISINSMQWIDYINSKDPYRETKLIPGKFGEKMTNFQKLILIRILKPEKVRQSCLRYLEEELGSFYVENHSVNIDELFADSNKKTPIIFVLSPGADPTEQLKAYAIETKKTEIGIISLGKEQEFRAEKELNEAKKAGRLLLLQNCHLAKSFMPKLENLVSRFEEEEATIHQDFRLLLSSMPADYFPISILQNGLKFITEPPAGIKANMTRTYCEIRENEFESCTKKHDWTLLLYGLSLFHAVVQERRKFGALGWNVRYEFNETDLSTSRTMLNDFLQTQETFSWEALEFITGHINYGGRVTDDWDRKLLICLFGKFLNPKMLKTEDFAFGENKNYILPNFSSLREYQLFVEKLPDQDEPDLFGMHENANITYETMLSNSLLNNILQIQPKVRPKSLGKTNDEIVSELVTKLKESLPEKLIKEVFIMLHFDRKG